MSCMLTQDTETSTNCEVVMKKTHLSVLTNTIACHRAVVAGTWTSDNWTRVTCQNCKDTDAYAEAKFNAEQAQEAAFQAQTPRTVVPQFGRVNSDGVMECFVCQGILWREKPRSLHSYHYVCEGCGQSVFPLTETGMCS